VISLSQLLFVYPPFPVRSICAAGPLLPNVQWTPDESGARSHRPVIADVFRPVGGCFLSTYRALCFVSSLLFVYPPFPASWICSCHRVIRRPLGTQLCGVTPLSSPTCLAGSAMVFFNVPCVAFPLSPLLFVYPPFPVGSISAAGPLLRNAHFTPDNSGVQSRLPVLADIFRRLGGCFFLRYRALSSVSPCYSLLIPPSCFFDRSFSPSHLSSARNSALRSDCSLFPDLFGRTPHLTLVGYLSSTNVTFSNLDLSYFVLHFPSSRRSLFWSPLSYLRVWPLM